MNGQFSEKVAAVSYTHLDVYKRQALDLGAAGIQIPQISNKTAAEKAIQYAKFYPQGNRGVCRYVRAAEYSSLEKSQYFKEANKAMIILQIRCV